MATYTHSFESGQASGTTVTTGNSGVGGTAFDTVSIGASAALTYDGTALRETLSLLATTGATSTTAEADWTSTTITAGISRIYGRFLVRPAVGSLATVWVRPFGSGSQSFRITIDATNHVTLRNNGSSLLVASTGTITTSDTWMLRFDVTVGASATGVLYVHYNPLVATPDETLTANSANFGTNNVNEVRWGIPVNVANAGVRLDDIVATDVGLPGPPIVSVSLSTVAAVADVPAPTLDTGGTTVTPSTVAAVAAVPSPTISTGSTVSPATVAAVASVPAPTVSTADPAVDENQWTATETDGDPIVRVTPTEGNWLIAVTSWHTVDGTIPTLAVGDLARNYWRRLGQSPPSDAGIGTEIWACPNVHLRGRDYTDVHVTVADVTGSDLGRVAVNVVEFSGLGDHITIEASVADTADAATAFDLTIPAPTATSLVLVGIVVDDDDTTVALTPGGWSGLTTVTETSAVELEQQARYKTSSSGETAAWTSSPAVSFAGVIVAIRQFGEGPDQPNPNWPAMQVQLGLGFDMSTPLPAVEWTSLIDRLAALQTVHGIQAEMGQPQAGEAFLDLRNNDGALAPRPAADTGTAAGDGTDEYIVIPDSQAASWTVSDFGVVKRDGVPLATTTGDFAVRVTELPSAFGFTNVTFDPPLTVATETGDTIEACPVDMYLPFRTLATWDGKTYPVVTGQVERWPQQTVDAHRVMVPATGIDALATLTADTVSPLRGEILRRRPWAYWPCDDPSGSPGAQNISGRTNTQLAEQVSKFGAGSATAGFGADTRVDGLHGINGDFGTAWEQAGLVAADTTEGYCLRADLDNPPQVADGVTIFLVAAIDVVGSGPTTEPTVFIVKNGDAVGAGTGAMLQLAADQTTGHAQISVWDKDTHARTDTVETTRIDLGEESFNALAVTFTRTSWTCYLLDSEESFSGSCDLSPTFSILSVFGEADEFFHGTMGNGRLAHVAVWDRALSEAELVAINDAHLWAGSGREFAHERIKRKLATSGWKGARILTAGDVLLSDDMGFEGRSVADMANEVASYEAGLTFVDAGGYLWFEARAAAADKTPQVVLGEDTAIGEVPYLPGLSYDFDPSFVYNHAEINRSADIWDTGTTHGFANSRTKHVADDTTSAGKYGLRTLSKDVRLYNLEDASALSEWLLSKYRTPTLRIQTVTIDPTANPDAWPAVLGTDVADLVTINRRPLGAPETSTECTVLSVRHEVTTRPQRWLTTWTLAAADPGTLVLDHDVRGIVGDNGLGW